MKLDIGMMPTALTADIVKQARELEEIGFDAVWTAETAHDPFFPIVLAAEHTSRIKMGTAVAVAFPRTPYVFAQIAWDLQAMSGGRFILGLGTQVKGHNERRLGVKWEQPGPKLREMVLCMRAIWDTWQHGTRPSFTGKFFNFTLSTPVFSAPPIEHPHIPIYIAGVNPYMCRLAGELCDGFHIHPFHSVKYLREVTLPNIAAGAAKAGRDPKSCALVTMAFVIVGDTPQEIAAATAPVKQQIAFYASTRTYSAVLETHGWGDTCLRLSEKAAKGDWTGMADEITDEMVDAFAVTGNWDNIADKVKRKYDGILDRVAFYRPYSAAERDRWHRVVKAFNG